MTPARPRVRRLVAVVLIAASVAACDDDSAAPLEPSPPGTKAVPATTDPPASSTTAVVVTTSEPPTATVDDPVEELLAEMTLAEKIGQMTLVDRTAITPEEAAAWNVGAILSGGGGAPTVNDPASWRSTVGAYHDAALTTRLGIPILYGVDAVHGVGTVRGATVFPHNIGLGAANDPQLVEMIGRVTATEMAATGMRWDYAPVVAVPGDPRWGRTFEGYSEDVETVSSLGAAFIRGLQSTGEVVATPKHYIGDGGTLWGTSTAEDFQIDQGDVRMDEAQLRARYLQPYEAAIAAEAPTIMVSFSSWNGIKMHANEHLLTDVLKTELGFDGFLVSDWAGIDQIPGDYPSDIVTSINAGVDMVMVPFEYEAFITGLTEAVERGDVSEERIDDAVRRILRVKLDMDLFELPLPRRVGARRHRLRGPQGARPRGSAGVGGAAEEHRAHAAAGSGDAARVHGRCRRPRHRAAEWRLDDRRPGQPRRDHAGHHHLRRCPRDRLARNRVELDPSGHFAAVTDEAGQSAVADVAIVVLAEQPYSEGAGDRADLGLPPEDLELLARVRPRAERLVVVLLSGRPLVVTEQLADWDAFVAAWLPGTEGNGVADVLFGKAPFTGRLPYTWPRSNEQLPIDPTAPPEPGCDGPLFPRGFGLTTDQPPPAPFCASDG